ncbi:hypothetical protein HY312_03050 [Candidatus Saccharibacteria bacterium]|nr:hypothetical protein [Candidatus Saccharibacteria bacterium]
MHRNFGSKSFNNSPTGGYKNVRSHYVSERGLAPLPEGVIPINRREKRLASKAIGNVVEVNREKESRYGDSNLPISSRLDEIDASIEQNPVTIVSGDTGCGKSTQVPLSQLSRGRSTIMMQPRRLAAEMVADRMTYHVRERDGDDAYGVVGCLTATKNTLTPNTKTMVVTDGVFTRQLPEILRQEAPPVLIIDEVHEWKTETEVALALVRHEMMSNPDHQLRVVLMSATPDLQVYEDFFTDVISEPLPSIDIKVPIHTIEDKIEAESTVAEQAFEYGQQGMNALCFVEGKREIKDAIDEITKRFRLAGTAAPMILPLHAKLPQHMRDAAIASYPNGKIIVATDVAQTSITIADIDVVIDSGRKREPHIDEEFSQSLDIVLASRDDLRQRRGRCGRVKDGIYILTRGSEEDDFVDSDDELRPQHSLPEIQRTEVDRTALYIANLGYDMAELKFPHHIDPVMIEHAKQSLWSLGALDDEGRITTIGRRMESLPMKPALARMVVESEQYSSKIRAQVLAMTAAAEAGGLQYFEKGVGKKWNELLEQSDSDMIAQLELFIASMNLTKKEQVAYNLDPLNIEQSQLLYRKVMKRVGMDITELVPPNPQEIDNIKRCIYTGMIDYVYEYTNTDEYMRAGGNHPTPREISNRSVVKKNAPMVVGYPYRYEYMDGGESVAKHIIEKVTRIPNPAVLGQIAAHLTVWKPEEHALRGGRLMQRQAQYYRDTQLGVTREVEAEATGDSIEYLVDHIMQSPGSALKNLYNIESTLKVLRKLSLRAPKTIPYPIRKLLLFTKARQIHCSDLMKHFQLATSAVYHL